jgi:23S rRNA (pseudouridine1915-N3)-methyltransferase
LFLIIDRMKVRLVVVGRTDESYLRDGLKEYEARIKRYLTFDTVEIPGLKNALHLSRSEWKAKEAAKILPQLAPSDFAVLLDEKGKEMTSVEFSVFLNQKFSGGGKNLVFIVGGPYGFDESVKKRADFRLSLSKMTFSHQMVRLFFLEQLYRALTILRNESYHHE